MKVAGYKAIAAYLSDRMGEVSERTARAYRAGRGLPVTEEWNGRIWAESDKLDDWLDDQREAGTERH